MEKLTQLASTVDMMSRTITNPDRTDLSLLEAKEASSVLVKNNLLFPRSVKSIHDPIIAGQEYGLISFTPAKDVSPNQNGIYGVLKSRGNFGTLEEAQKYAENLVRNHDSYNEIHTIRVGQCIPLSKRTELVEETNLVDVNKEVESIVSQDVKSKRQQEKKEMKTIQEREQQLLQENKEILDGDHKENPMEKYIMLRVKKAQLMWTLVENRKRLENEVIPAIRKAKEEIREMNEEYPDFDKEYYERYMHARESVGIKEQDKLSYSNFMHYLLDDNDVEL